MTVYVTGRRRARERLAVLGEASTHIGRQEPAEPAVPQLADHAILHLVDVPPGRLAWRRG